MTIQVDFWHLVGLLLGFIGTLASFGKILLRQLDARIDQQKRPREQAGKPAQRNADQAAAGIPAARGRHPL